MYSKKNRQSKYMYQPSVGVKVDFETILHRFSSANTVRYETFAALCREMKLSQYCAGRQTQNEAREFVEECFQIAAQFWLPPSQFLVRAGALYLLYCLYYYQSVEPKSKIRVTVEMWKEIVEFQAQAREQQHLDLDYVFQRMKLDRAFVFVAVPTYLYPDQKTSNEVTRTIPENLKEDSNSVSEVFSSSTLNQLALVHEQYHKMKVVLNSEDTSKPDTSLDIIHSDLIRGIYKTLQVHKDRQLNISQGYHSLRSKDQPDEDEGEDENSMRQLKKKAYEALPGYIRGAMNYGSKVSDTEGKEEVVNSKPYLSPPGQKKHRKRGGRPKVMALFEKDDALDDSSIDTQTRIDGMFSMPDVSKIMPKPIPDTDANGKVGTKKPSPKGKAPLKGKALKKTQKRKSQVKQETIEMEPDSKVDSTTVEQIEEIEPGSEVCVDETVDKEAANNVDSAPMEESPTKIRKTMVEQTVDELVENTQERSMKAKKKGKSGDANDLSVPVKVTKVVDDEADEGESGKKSTRGEKKKPMGGEKKPTGGEKKPTGGEKKQTGGGEKKPTKVADDEADEGERGKKPTAQEKLQQLLNKRKKEARDKKKKKN